jgi:hypothetical protein
MLLACSGADLPSVSPHVTVRCVPLGCFLRVRERHRRRGECVSS